MFYSQTFLARKGPLGTVWCAAHLQHKLKKSHYATTDIPSTVERILYPEVPIALRMSGHLLLGVVRIYSKKLDYLYQDCNVLLIGISKAFAPAEINLPEDANHAQFDSVTLPTPTNFALDALNLDDYNLEGLHDNHLKSQEEITLTDQIPTGRDPYVFITVSEDARRDSSHLEDASGSTSMPMEEDSHPSIPLDTPARFQDPGPSNQMEIPEKPNEDSIPGSVPDIHTTHDAVHDDVFPEIHTMRDAVHDDAFPEIHTMRDAVHDDFFPDARIWQDRDDDVIEPDGVLEQQFMTEKDNPPPALEDMLVPGGQSLTSKQDQLLHSAASEQGHENSDRHMSLGLASPNMVIQSTPPIERPKSRRRKRQYDEKTVLTNKFMKKALEDSSHLLRKRIGFCSSLDCWKLNNIYKREKVFLEPLMTGLCDNLCNIFSKDYISTRSDLVSTEEACPETSVAKSPAPMPEIDVGIHRLRNFESPGENNTMQDFMPSPDRFFPSSARKDDFSPATGTDLGSKSDQTGTMFGTGILPTPDLAASTGSLMSDMETPMTFPEQPGFEKTDLSDIPELENSGELTFLEEDDSTPGFIGTPEIYSKSGKQKDTPQVVQLSARSWAVGKYLENKSSVIPNSENLYEDLSLNKILEGKRRKVCARMFYETLVLKSGGYVEVRQDEPYGDISLKPTCKLKEQFSS